jgi:multimeric flavodoxin WrbA
MRNIIIQGSSRSAGNSHQIAKIISNSLAAEIIDLRVKTINSYSYEHNNADDDFLPVMRQILAYETIIFITPVYWYSMSGLMKNFFDRISDCLKTEKDLGRKLRGKNMIAIACGSDETEVEGFFVPFKNSAEYLGMNYLGNLHTWVEHKIPGEVVLKRIELFTNETKIRLANNQS